MFIYGNIKQNAINHKVLDANQAKRMRCTVFITSFKEFISTLKKEYVKTIEHQFIFILKSITHQHQTGQDG